MPTHTHLPLRQYARKNCPRSIGTSLYTYKRGNIGVVGLVWSFIIIAYSSLLVPARLPCTKHIIIICCHFFANSCPCVALTKEENYFIRSRRTHRRERVEIEKTQRKKRQNNHLTTLHAACFSLSLLASPAAIIAAIIDAYSSIMVMEQHDGILLARWKDGRKDAGCDVQQLTLVHALFSLSPSWCAIAIAVRVAKDN